MTTQTQTLTTIITNCDRLIASQSGAQWLRDEIAKIRDLAREGLERAQSVTTEQKLSDIDAFRQGRMSEPWK